MRRAVIVIPTYNEAGNIKSLIEAIFQICAKINNWDMHVLVVDSKSNDGTAQHIRQLIKLHPKNLRILEMEKEGLGKAYITGFNYALDHLAPYVMFEMDADWSHDPKEIPNFLLKIEKGADFVIGSRYMKGGSIPKNWFFYRKLFSFMANLFARLGFMKLKMTEWTNGYRAIKSWLIKDIIPELTNYSGYVFQVAFLDQTLKRKAYIEQIPIQFKDRERGISKINAVQYIWQTIVYVLTNSSFIRYVIVGLIGFGIDFGISYLLIEKVKTVIWIATLVSTEISIVSNFLFNNFWSFAHKKLEHKLGSYIPSFLKFNLVSSGSILIQVVGVSLLSHFFGQKLWIIYKILVIAFVVVPYSYIFYNKFIWKEK